MKQNEGTLDRTIRIVLGLAFLVASTYTLTGTIQIFVAIVGLISLFTGFTGFCGIYRLLGISTLKKTKSIGKVKK